MSRGCSPIGRLVQHVERVHQPRAQGVGERDSLGLAAGERAGLPLESEIAEPDVAKKAEPGVELIEDQLRDLLLERRQREPAAASRDRVDRPRGHRADGLARRCRTASASGLSRVPPQAVQVCAS